MWYISYASFRFAHTPLIMNKSSCLIVKLGKRIRSLRNEMNISQEELAFRADLHRTYIGMIERGEKNITLVNLSKIADALEVESCMLLHGVLNNSPNLYISNCMKKKTNAKSKSKQNTTENICYNSCANHKTIMEYLAENSYDIIHVLKEDGTIIYENSATERILGYKAGERIGLNGFEFVHKEDYKHVQSVFKKILSKPQKPQTAEFRFQHENGSWVWFESHAQNLLENPIINGIVVNSRKICHRKQYEEALKEKEAKLMELYNTKNKFYSILAHDLRSPFQYILGISRILSEKANTFSEKEISGFSEHIYNSTKNTLNLLDNLLKWAEIQQGKMICNPDFFYLMPLIDECINMFSFPAKSKKIKLINDTKSDFSIFSDRYMLETIIRNLINNSIKFTKSGGIVKIYAVQKETTIEIIIEDNGIGMSAKIRASLFKLDKNNSVRGTEGEKGTGLGLLLCKDLTEKLSGSISVKSKLGTGTKFILSFPYAISNQ